MRKQPDVVADRLVAPVEGGTRPAARSCAGCPSSKKPSSRGFTQALITVAVSPALLLPRGTVMKSSPNCSLAIIIASSMMDCPYPHLRNSFCASGELLMIWLAMACATCAAGAPAAGMRRPSVCAGAATASTHTAAGSTPIMWTLLEVAEDLDLTPSSCRSTVA